MITRSTAFCFLHIQCLACINHFNFVVSWGLGLWCLNVTFNNISVISWRSVLLMEKIEYPEKTTDLRQVTVKLCHIMFYRVHPTISEIELTTLVVIDTEIVCWEFGCLVTASFLMINITPPPSSSILSFFRKYFRIGNIWILARLWYLLQYLRNSQLHYLRDIVSCWWIRNFCLLF
jgi:hypothetical protein